MSMPTVIVTGGAGFIGSAMVRHLLQSTKARVINVDNLTYAGNLASLNAIADNENYVFEQVDICDRKEMERVFAEYKPDTIIHFAAESHVDRSIDSAAEFMHTNIIGSYILLEVALSYWQSLDQAKQQDFRFHHVSTDEVYGSLGEQGLFTETTAYDPSSPYSASKASSDHLVRAWHRTYGLPVIISNCSNNYGPYQFPEKLIPHMIICATQGKPLPVYGAGNNVRDWLYVDDHVRAIWKIICDGKTGETYNIGGHNEKTNLEVVHALCSLLDELLPDSAFKPHKDLIHYVKDRPGHDMRYAIDASKLENELGWIPDESFETGMKKTVEWYLQSSSWWQNILDGSYQQERLGLSVNKAT